MAAVDVTRGAIAAILEGQEGVKPVVQVWDLRLVNTQQNTTERYRMLLSDRTHKQQAMLATQMNGIVKSGSLRKHSIVQLNEFICNVIQNRTIIIVIDLDVLVSSNRAIGEPKIFDNGTPLQNQASVPAQSSSVDQPTVAAANPQTYGLHSATPSIGQNVSGGASLHRQAEPRTNNPSFGGTYSSGTVSSRNMNSEKIEHPKLEHSMGWFSELHPYSGNQNERSNSTSVGVFRPPASSPAHSVDRQPPPTVLE